MPILCVVSLARTPPADPPSSCQMKQARAGPHYVSECLDVLRYPRLGSRQSGSYSRVTGLSQGISEERK
jgi:hypothetical protein